MSFSAGELGIAKKEKSSDGSIHRRRPRIGRRSDCANETDRLCVFDDAEFPVFFDDADRLHAQEVTKRTEGLALLLDDLVGHVAELGILDRQFGQFFCMRKIVKRPGKRCDCIIDPRLVGLGE